MSVYRSKIDAWVGAALAFAAACSVYAAAQAVVSGVPAALWMAVWIAGIGFGLPAWLMATTRYTLEPRQLLVRSGPFFWRIPFSTITRITPSASLMAGPALSLERLRIEYGRGRVLLISPRDTQRFVDEIEGLRRALPKLPPRSRFR